VILTERTSASSATRALAAARAAAAAADAPASEGPLRLLRPHHGIDYGMLRSLAIRSASAGEIIGAGYLTSYEGYGMVVVVDLGDGHTLIYSHLTRVAVATGDTVEPGDPIGTAGCTGVCYGTHLHFELRRNGKPIDPTPYIVAAR
jgi:murein DD-endopeptidase MepM/ murein hydrolase activator NlpD